MVDPEGFIRLANPRAGVLFGCEPDDMVGLSVDELVPEAARGRHGAHRDRYMEEPVQRPMGVGMELLARRLDGSVFPVEISLGQWMVEGVPMVLATVRDVSMRRRLRDFGASALRAAEEVRLTIARDLHDETAQQLSAHLIRLRLLERATTEEERAEHLEALRSGLHETVESVRRTARGLRPPELDDAGLAAALQVNARALHDSRGIDVVLDVEEVDHLLSRDQRLVLYRIIQEALTNVARHSGAGAARVRVRVEDGQVVGEVRDRGRGFLAQRQLLRGDGLGLLGMQERAAMIGGRLTVESAPDQGTCVSVAVPVSGTRGSAGSNSAGRRQVPEEVGGV